MRSHSLGPAIGGPPVLPVYAGEAYHAALGSTASLTLAFHPTANIPAGDLAVAAFATFGSSNKYVTAVTDDAGGNTWRNDVAGSAGGTTAVFSCNVATTITTSNLITVTFSAAVGGNVYGFIELVSSFATLSWFDQAVVASTAPGGAGLTSGPTTGTLAQADEILFMFFISDTAANYSNAGATQWTFTAGSPNNIKFVAAYDIVSATTPVTGAIHVDRALNDLFVVVAYK